MFTGLRQMAARVLALFRPSRLDRDLDTELESHLSLLADEHERRGMRRGGAGRTRGAPGPLGGLAQIREASSRGTGRPAARDALLQDLRYHVPRALRRDAEFLPLSSDSHRRTRDRRELDHLQRRRRCFSQIRPLPFPRPRRPGLDCE